jgi:predicted ATPase
LLDQLEALARQKPVLMLFEDLHWADATSLEVLDLTVERVRGLPVLALFTFRPEYEAPWTGLSHVTSIALDRFAPAEVETLAERVAGRPLPAEVTAQIVAKTDGVPLFVDELIFVDELTKAVLEGGLLVAGPQGWRKAIALADKLAATAPSAAPGSNRLRLQTSLGNALFWAKGYGAPETSAAFARARELASRMEDASERFSAYYGLWIGHLARCEPAPLREMAELFLREATAGPDCPEAVVAYRNFGTTCLYFGDFAGAHDHLQKTIELYDPARHVDFANRFGNDPRAVAEVYDAISLWVFGRVDEALPLAERALTDAESAAHPPTMATTLVHAAQLGLFRYNLETVATYSRALADIVSRYDLPAFWSGVAPFFQGRAKSSDGSEESRLAEMRGGIGIEREQGRVRFLPAAEAALAEAEAGAGDIAAGLRHLDDALAEVGRTEQRWCEAEMHRIRAGILLKRDPTNTAAAEQSLQAAIAIAQSQRARSFELRAALSLAKLYRAANHDADAHTVLAPAVEGFPPTQQFPELANAQTLLPALSI